jgi:hypothetical protein
MWRGYPAREASECDAPLVGITTHEGVISVPISELIHRYFLDSPFIRFDLYV